MLSTHGHLNLRRQQFGQETAEVQRDANIGGRWSQTSNSLVTYHGSCWWRPCQPMQPISLTFWGKHEPKNRSSNMGWKRRLVVFGFQINDHFQLWVWQPQIRYHFTQWIHRVHWNLAMLWDHVTKACWGPNQKVTYSKRTFYPCLSHVFYVVRQSTKSYQKKLVSMGKQRGVGQSLRARAAKLVMRRVSQNLDHWFDGLSETRK